MIDEEELTLVVADDVPHSEVALDDLIGRADGQWRLAGEFLERRAVTVDGCVVEVGAEFVDGILRVLAHENLAAEADDRLIGGAVTVVFPALAVELDHALGVVARPEDVVVEEAVAVVGGLFRDFGAADRTVPNERGNPIERAWRRRELMQRGAVLALEVDALLPPECVQERVVLDGEGDAVADVLAEPGVDGPGVATAHHEIDAAVGEVLEVGVVLGETHGVVRRDQRRRRGEDELLRLRRDVSQQDWRIRGRDERRVVVLAGGEDVHADFFCLLRDGERGLDPFMLGGRLARGGVCGDVADGEHAELHGNS